MEAISYERATDVAGAVRAAQRPGAAFIGGGTNLLDLMKGGVARPSRSSTSRTSRASIRSRRCPAAACASARARAQQRCGRSSAPARRLSAAVAGAARRRVRAIAQHGDRRRQPDAAHALPVFLRSRVRAMQQARAGQRLRGDRRPQPDARDPRCQLPVRGGEPVGHERRARRARRRRAGERPARRAADSDRIVSPLAGRSSRPRHDARAGRADHRGGLAAAAPPTMRTT